MIHTNAIAYGFIANAFLGMLHWAVPRLDAAPGLPSPAGSSYAIFAAWQVVVLPRPSASCSARPRGWNGARPRSGSTRSRWLGLLLVAINFIAADRQDQRADVRDASGTSWPPSSGRS